MASCEGGDDVYGCWDVKECFIQPFVLNMSRKHNSSNNNDNNNNDNNNNNNNNRSSAAARFLECEQHAVRQAASDILRLKRTQPFPTHPWGLRGLGCQGRGKGVNMR